jgi:hypothetical protein
MSQAPISPLRRRMIEDMTVRGFGEKTQSDYIRHVSRKNARRDAFFDCVEGTSGSNPTGWIGVMPLAVQRVWVDRPRWAGVRGHKAPQLMGRTA